MTTIVYDHKNKQIAIDSRTAAGTFICTDYAIKHYSVDDSLLFLAGSLSDIDIFIAEYPDIKTEVECTGYSVKDKTVFCISTKDGKLKKSTLTYNDSDGSGYAYAISAIDFGKTAKEAVEYAMIRDSSTGGKVHVYDIEKGDFI